jgi:hypothetical protein
MVSLSLILHLAEVVGRGTGGPVSQDAAASAVAWCGYLEAHARRIYQSIADPSSAAAAALSAKLLKGALPNPFTVRDVYRAQWTGLATREDIEPGLLLLETLHWVTGETARGRDGGRPTRQYRVNPKLPGGQR